MGNPKQKWTAEEEEALRAGVAKHGAGKWKLIQRDPEFNHLLHSRSNIDLKDKWRNLNVANGPGPRDKSKTPKAKGNNPDAAAASIPASTPAPVTKTAASSTPASAEASADAITDDSSKCLLDGKTASKYNAMIYEALSTLKNPNGSDTGTIVSFIEQRHEVPPNFRRLLSSRLRRLVAQEKLEKVENCYRIKDVLLEAKAPAPQQKEPSPQQVQNHNTGFFCDTLEEASVAAAYKVAEAENKASIAAEAVKEAERVSKMAEDAESLLQLATEIFEKCAQGEIVLMA